MDLPRSTYYAASGAKASDAAIVAEMIAITDEFECYGYRRVGTKAAAVALANKMARIAWGLMARGETYAPQAA